MMRQTCVALGALLSCTVAAVASPPVADDLLKTLPEKTLCFVEIPRLAQTDARLAAFSQQAHWPLPGLLALFKAQAGVQEGLDEQGSAALVMVGEDQFDEPPVVLYVPVTDYNKFLAPVKRGEAKSGIARVMAWKETFLVKQVGRYAVFAELQHEEVLTKGLTPGGLEKSLAPLASFLAESDLSVVVTQHGVHLLARMVEQQMREMRSRLGGGEQTASARSLLDFYDRLFEAADREASALAAGLRFEQQGVLRLSGRVCFRPSGDAAVLVAKCVPTKEPQLAGLPAGPFVLAGSLHVPPPLWEATTDAYADLLRTLLVPLGLTGEQGGAFLKSSIAMMRGLRVQSVLLQPGKGMPIYRDMGVVMRVGSAKQFLADYERSIRACADTAQTRFNKVGMAISVRPLEIQRRKALELTLQLPPMPMPEVQQICDRMFGPGGKMNAYLVAADEHTIVTSYMSKELLAAAIDTLEHPTKGLAADPLVAKIRALLPADALALGYWSPSGMATWLNRVFEAFAGIPVMLPSLPGFPATPPVGFAACAAPAQLQAEIVVPAEVLRAVMPYGLKVADAFQGGR
jgi:hypothetical protein